MADRAREGVLDAVGLVEQSYNLDGDEESWLRALTEAAALDLGLGSMAYTYDERSWQDAATGAAVQELHCWNAPRSFEETMWRLLRSMPAEWVRWLHGTAPVFCSVSGTLGGEGNFLRSSTTGTGIGDAKSVFARDGTGRCVVLQQLCDSVVDVTPAERRLWERLAVHVGAGLRLRRSLTAGPSLDDPLVDAVLDPQGRCLDARRPARAPNARATLREAARRIDQARGRGVRQQPEVALDLWQGLVAGKWSLVDHFDSDGRRFVVALRNTVARTDPRGLTLRQRQVSALAVMGQPNKLIAYTLGVSPSAVSAHLSSALRKLGLSCVAELRAITYPRPAV
jgi:DNA-binding CsgD family transcriptional regulator